MTLDPWWVRRRLRRLLWRYDGGTFRDLGFDVGFVYIHPDADKFIQSLYDRVTALVRYLRQPVDWVWNLDMEEVMRWETSLETLLKAEAKGTEEPTPTPVAMDPWGFGDRD